MRQIILNYKTGELRLAEVPAPALKPDTILVQTASSLISIGTQRYMLDLARKGLLGKALARPDLAKQVVNKVRIEGLAKTYRQVMHRLDTPVPMGYSATGVVIAVGDGVTGFVEGDRVACAGSGIASHAEILRVPPTLAIKIPDNVSFEAASFVAQGAISAHGVRMANVAFGDRVVVLGLGLLGQLAVQILNAAGCRVFGTDIVSDKVNMALEHGAHAGTTIGQNDTVGAVRTFTDGHGADAVIIFAGTKSNEPIELAAELARERGHIVVPGLVGLDIPRKTFYEKELDFAVSRAWGPGMYDPEYEAGKIDYPLPFVRWTAQRNMAHFLEMLGDGQVVVEHLITHRFPIDESVAAHEMSLDGKGRTIGVILQYPGQPDRTRTIRLKNDQRSVPTNGREAVRAARGKDLAPRDPVRIGLIGAGLFAKGILLPALKGIDGAVLHGVATSTGVSAEHVARKYDLAYCTTGTDEILNDPEIDLVMIVTRHGSHASLVCKALAAGKHVFVEKPLALNEAQLQQVIQAYHGAPGQLMVGFNRRFAPTTLFAIERLAGIERPLVVTVRANVGYIPPEVWVHDPEQGGGNIIGEACHFVDLIQALTGSSPVSVFARAVRAESDAVVTEDNAVITLSMANGSVGTVIYTALGDKAHERERVEIFGGGAACVIENFKTLTWSHNGRRKRLGNMLTSVDRGHRTEIQALIAALRQGQPFPVPFESYVATTRATFAAIDSLCTGRLIEME